MNPNPDSRQEANYQKVDVISDKLAHLEGRAEHFATNENVALLKTEIAQLETRMTRWIMGVLAGLVLVVINVVISTGLLVLRLLS